MKLFLIDISKYLLLIFTLSNHSILTAITDTSSPPSNKNTLKIELLGAKIDNAIDAKNFALAESLLAEAKKDKKLEQIANFRLAKLAASQNNSEKVKNYLKALGNSSLTKNTALMSEIYFSLNPQDRPVAAVAFANYGLLEARRPSLCPFFELEARTQRGTLLAEMVNTKNLSTAQENLIWQELYLELPEVVPESSLNLNIKFAAWQKSLKPSDLIERINKLMLFGKNKEAQETYEYAIKSFSKLSKDQRCAFDYEAAKLKRKMRKYKDARKLFQSLVQSCSGDIKQKARYKDLQLAAMTSDAQSLEQFDKFVRDYPTHGFSDDVLMFKTSLLLDHSKKTEAQKTLDYLITKFPNGDMIDRALFKKIILLAKDNKAKEALVLLKKLKAKSPQGSIIYAQATYWLNRLKIFPDLSSLSTKKLPTKELISELSLLFQSDSPTIYSWLAGVLLTELKELPKVISSKNIIINTNNNAKSTRPSLTIIKSLIQNGFTKEALALLREEPVTSQDKNTVGAIAELYISTGHPESGHQKLIRCNWELANALKKHWPQYYNQISWAKPFKSEVLEVATELKIPPNLIYGIMRQESGFLSNAFSWAQARGLMQLMESTAEEQRKKLSLKKFEPEDLFDTKLNILLGSNVIKSYWQQFGNLAIALSAYNAGPAPATRWQKSQASQPIDTFIENIPFPDTYSYVKEVLGSLFAYATLDNNIKEVLNSEANLGQCYLYCRAEH